LFLPAVLAILLIFLLPAASKAQLSDRDRDGLTNAYEGSIGTDPFDADSDNDGMPDGWEVSNGTNAVVPDAAGNPDTDGLSNTDEEMVGSDSLGYYDQNVFEMFLFVGRGKGYNTP
jgi:hypothetical protein